MELPKRDKNIRLTIVEEYLATGIPMSSSRVFQRGIVSVSSATLRNTTKKLEEDRDLIQSHTSAGRIPTVLGLRVYVDEVRVSELNAVFIGSEIKDLGEGLSLIACGFQRADNSRGIVGVLGPSRMNYPHLILLVDHTAHMISGAKIRT